MPRVLSPASWFTFTGVTLDPTLFDVLPGISRPERKKSSAVTCIGGLQAKPFTRTVRSNALHMVKSYLVLCQVLNQTVHGTYNQNLKVNSC